MKRTLAIFLVAAALLVVGSSDAQPAKKQAAKSCQSPIFLLGGDTAVIREPEIDTVDKLREALEKEKFLKALQETLDAAGLGVHFTALKEKLKAAELSALRDVEPGTQLEWMSYRSARDKKVYLGRHSCWAGEEPFRAWFVNLDLGDGLRTLILPRDCFNLALLVKKPPTCTITAEVACSGGDKLSLATVTVAPLDSTGRVVGKVDLTGTKPDGKPLGIEPSSKTESPYQWKEIPLEAEGTYKFDATVTADNGLSSTCTTSQAVCKKPEPYECPAPSCDLTVEADWQPESPPGSLKISFTPDDEKKTSVCITKPGESTCQDFTCNSGRCTVTADKVGIYSVRLTKTLSGPGTCKERTATCTSTVDLREPPPPIVKIVPQLCCISPWFLRAWGGYVESQGSQASGLFRLHPDEVGTFQFGFNQGLAFGVEAERRLSGIGKQGELGPGWGWAFGLLYADLDNVWVFDSSRSWLMDNDRVPLLVATTGPSYHWQAKGWDLHAGPRLGLAHFDEGSYTDGSNLMGTFHEEFDNALAFGASVGADAYFGEKSCWGLSLGLDYLKLEASGDRIEVDVDPLVVKAGFVYRF